MRVSREVLRAYYGGACARKILVLNERVTPSQHTPDGVKGYRSSISSWMEDDKGPKVPMNGRTDRLNLDKNRVFG